MNRYTWFKFNVIRVASRTLDGVKLIGLGDQSALHARLHSVKMESAEL